jgi:hypothetical protein
MATPMWFGTKQRLQWVPMPSSGIQRRNVFSSEGGTLDRGGAYVSRSIGRHAEFDFSFGVREALGTEGLNVYQEYATGLWDDYVTAVSGYNPNNLIYFCDPMSMRANLFSPHWAAPMLSLSGDYPHLGTVTGHAATEVNTYRQPSRAVTYNITHAANTLPASPSQQFMIPIPPGHTLYWGWSGSVTGAATMRIEAQFKVDNSLVSANIGPVAPSGLTRMTSVTNYNIQHACSDLAQHNHPFDGGLTYQRGRADRLHDRWRPGGRVRPG